MQVLIFSLENQQSSFRHLSDLIREESTSAKEHVTEEFDHHRKDREKAEYCSKYLDSLAFPEMRARQEIIIDPYSETFQWIFDESGKAVRPWGNFVEWLRNGQSIYWIQGKAGSGKSTLMSYICEDQRTEASLKTWAGAHELLIVPFFFWKAGNDRMQKTSAGLIRSLLHQILEKLPALILSLTEIHNEPRGFQTGGQGFPSIPAWTEKQLLMNFQRLLSELSSTHHLCFFIDGLDEIDGNQNDLVELLQDRVKGPIMKMCLSSRPDRSFIDAFSSPAMLRLEDLTRKDIKLYVSRKLERAWRKSPAMDDKKLVPRMIDTILKKARGVFQWVHIVVGYQIQGLQSKDGLEELWERLGELPEEIGELYAYMLEKIDKVHRKEVASYLQIILQVQRKPSITELTLALYERREIIFSPQSILPLIEIASQCTKVRERVKLICGGLLEFRERKNVSGESENSNIKFVNEEISSDRGESPLSTHQSNNFERAKITFHQNWTTHVHLIHRTAYDFLMDSQVGKEFVKSNIPSGFDVYGSYMEARLAQLVIFAQNEEFYRSPSSQKPAGPLSFSKKSTASLDPLESTASLSSDSSASFTTRKYHGIENRKRDKTNFQVEIYVIMKLASFVEAEINEAQATLNEKIDRVVTMLDQRYLHEPSDTHWCTRWGFLQNEVDMSGGTRSRDSSSSASSIQDVPTVPLDFLCFAAYHGLHLYVLDIIQTRLEQDDPDTMTVLLRFTMNKSERFHDCLELGTVLLRRGANPNVLSCTKYCSVWTQFLESVESEAEEGLPRATEEQLPSTARTFIESGADVNAKRIAFYGNPFNWLVSGDVRTELKKFEPMHVCAEMSLLAYLQDAMAHFLGFGEIEKMCIARGALSTSKTICLWFDETNLVLSPRQSKDFDKIVSAWSSRKAGRPLPLPLESLREILLRLHDELKLDKVFTDENTQTKKTQTMNMQTMKTQTMQVHTKKTQTKMMQTKKTKTKRIYNWKLGTEIR